MLLCALCCVLCALCSAYTASLSAAPPGANAEQAVCSHAQCVQQLCSTVELAVVLPLFGQFFMLIKLLKMRETHWWKVSNFWSNVG